MKYSEDIFLHKNMLVKSGSSTHLKFKMTIAEFVLETVILS